MAEGDLYEPIATTLPAFAIVIAFLTALAATALFADFFVEAWRFAAPSPACTPGPSEISSHPRIRRLLASTSASVVVLGV